MQRRPLFYLALRREYWRVALRQVMSSRLAMLSFGVLCLYGAVGFLDTLHFRVVSQANPGGGNIQSVLDLACRSLVQRTEKTYSAPFATHLCQGNHADARRPAGAGLSALTVCRDAPVRRQRRWPDVRQRL